LIIPKVIRQQLGWQSGMQLRVEVVEQRIILESVKQTTSVEVVYGKYTGVDF
jgi:AbrB family looped-hinge helix DNA binding protein